MAPELKYDNGRVDITKLTYSSNYRSHLYRTNNPSGPVQCLRFAAIIALLESIVLDSLRRNSSSSLLLSSACILLAVTFGKKAVGSHQRSFVLLLLATCLSLGSYYATQ